MSTDHWGLIILVILILLGVVLSELRERWTHKRERASAQIIEEWRTTTHLDDCRHGIHRTTLDADHQQVFGEQAIAPYVIYERCIDCGLVVPFGEVTHFTPARTHRKSHG